MVKEPIGILTAMEEELTPLLQLATVEGEEEFGRNRYYFGRLGGKRVVMAYSKIGKVFSAITATTMVLRYRIGGLLFSGVAGGLDPQLQIGDLVLATSLCQHDVDLTIFGHPRGYIPGGKRCYETDPHLRRLGLQVGKRLGLPVTEGVIVSGDQFVADPRLKEEIRREFNGVAIEMEGAAVGKVCWSFEIPYLVVRAISDGAGEGAEVDFEQFLEESSWRSAQLVTEILKEL